MYDFLKKLKAGDLVIVSQNHDEYVSHVKRTTKTQIILVSGKKFRKYNGQSIGTSTWYHSHLREATPDRIVEITRAFRRAKIKSSINNDILDKCSDDEILLIWKVIKPKLEEKL